MNISTQTFKCTPNTHLEKAYRKSQYLKDAQLQVGLYKELDLILTPWSIVEYNTNC